MKVFTFSEARQHFSTVLDYAQKEGSVQVSRRDGRVFVIQAVEAPVSPLAVTGINLNLQKDELLGYIHESRRV